MAENRCEAKLAYHGLQCDLSRGHKSQHFSRRNGTLIHWRAATPTPRPADDPRHGESMGTDDHG